jgi:muramoyltetrapeptide carboxypeptidase
MGMTSRLKPKRLRPGDILGIIAPAGWASRETITAGVQWLEVRNFRTRLGRSTEQQRGYLSGPDEARAADINEMFAASDIAGIICLRGGYGSMRLLDLLDYDRIRENPKVFVGFSDITALHAAISLNTGLVTFHGPMVASSMAGGLSEYTQDYFMRALTSAQPLGPVINPPQCRSPVVIAPGMAQGPLAGGNLSILAALLGTPYEIETQGKILCLEEVNEAPYRLDRMLTQLLLAEKLQPAAGIIMDACTGCDKDEETPGFTVEEVLRDRLGSLGIPVLYHMYFGHTREQATLPLGITATLDGCTGKLSVIEPATVD